MAANAWLEVTVVCAGLLGTVLGGVLISPWVVMSASARHFTAWSAAEALTLSLLALVGAVGGFLRLHC